MMWGFQIGSVAFALFTAALSAPSQFKRQATGKKVVSFADVFSGNFTVSRTTLQWTSQGADGSYIDVDSATGNLIIANIVSNGTSVFVKASDVSSAAQNPDDYSIQPSGDHVLFTTNYKKQYRHSFFADYYVFDVKAKTTVPLAADQAGDIQFAGWSPVGNTIAYVRGNNLFVWQNGTTTQITKDGGPDVFNAVPDWVYEEEIFGDYKTLWFSPDGEYIAYLRFDETGVPTYSIPYYMAGKIVAPPYPDTLELRYPKVGETNPTASFHLLSLSDLAVGPRKVEFESFAPHDLIIGEVAWVTDDHSNVIFRTFNRVQDQEKLLLVDTATASAKVVRERDGRPGWIENNIAIQYVGNGSYVDLSDASGYLHIYLYDVAASTPTPITSGEWEVTSILNIDSKRGKVYYQSTEHGSNERHVYSVNLNGSGKKALVDDEVEGYWTASFSSGSGYYILSYNGPNLPNQKLYSANSSTIAIKTINDNARLAAKLEAYTLPNVTWSTIDHPDGYSFNVMERLPPNFDPSKRYPVVFDPYGGPNSQQTGKTFKQVEFRAYLASDPELEYVILTVDNRGTGFKGRDFRTPVTQQLGKLEAIDQVYAAKEWAKKPYIDPNHVAIMGWSYGGYLAAKVVETDSSAFTFALITAPVSDWRFYDSMYTERYMKNITNSDGTNGTASYLETSVHNSAGFKNIKGGFLIQHGTGDDNVHFQHSAVMTDTLTRGGVGPSKMNVQWFTDSDHSINFHGASTLVYKQMARYLWLERNRKDSESSLSHQFNKRGDVPEMRGLA
ncbi:extracellular dipeptidyl-peptidase Dpp4 [Amylocarpus encephaloides]|uniref:dipeptidyl-peptidase IV n=1 Tax=Amylocarpus encephaloides TaxID=45428 RepID=A0A9P7Y9X3_9HELO|nr:extracellular dipeptidyl-peptidase Dpp4 [Amylocarpus encephaloides]